MDRFRTLIHLTNPGFTLDHTQHIYSIGSCFAGCMGKRFSQNKFKALSNPFGVIFNPMSLFKLLETDENTDWEEGLLENNGLWFHYDLHSEITAASKAEMLAIIKERVDHSQQMLNKADVLIITLGTALVYQRKAANVTVANCHKMPAALFDKLLLSPEAIEERATAFLDHFLAQRPGCKVILTVSPVRHIKDTLPLNSVSKSVLRYACHRIESRYAQVHYFPSYELMNDELRDYRFYKADMIHPSEVAEEYIWERFSDTFFSANTQSLLKEWDKLYKALQHRPFNPSSTGHQQFLRNTLAKLEAMQHALDVSSELEYLRSQLVQG